MIRSLTLFFPWKPLKNIQFCPRSRKMKILTTGIHLVFRGLKFESDAEIGQKGMFFSGLILLSMMVSLLFISACGTGKSTRKGPVRSFPDALIEKTNTWR